MWLSVSELDDLEDRAFSDDESKGSLFVISWKSGIQCPVCSEEMKRFRYRFHDLELDFCQDHGYWLDADEDKRILQLMKEKPARLRKKYDAEAAWYGHLRAMRSRTFFAKVKDLFR